MFDWFVGSALQWALIGVMFGCGILIALGIVSGNGSTDAEDDEQAEAVSKPAPLLWGDAQTTQRRRAGQID